MPIVLKCPVCGRHVLSRQLELLVSTSLTNLPQADIVVCHCPDSHRFVASLKHIKREALMDEPGGETEAENEGLTADLVH